MKKMQFPYLFFIFIFLTISFEASVLRCQTVTCNSNDFKVLTSFANCLGSVIDGWNLSTSNCCTWNGVTCDNSTISSKRVVELKLEGKRLTGVTCVSLLEGLDQLRFLNVSHNFLRGNVPAKLFRLQNLEVLDLSNNDCLGSIPAESYLPSIRYFDISMNNFNGSFDARFCEISPHLQVLNLASNNFQGKVSTSFVKCVSLQRLFLNGNKFSGSFPDSLLQLQDLRVLHIQDNCFFAPLNDGIGNLSNLVELDISSNNFYGHLPDIFGRLGKLKHFSATLNAFTGHLPRSLLNSSSLETLDLNANLLDGPSQFNCSAMNHLISLNLGSNNFHLSILESISSCQRLSLLNLARNNLSGEIPHNFKNLQALRFLSLSNNSLVNITATLEILKHCKNLTTLVLSMNFQDEEMPSDVNLQFENLKALAIPCCELRGPIPLWFNSLQKLQLLDLSWNRLDGSIPLRIGNLSSLFYLDLSHNSFTGKIPKSLTELQALIDNKDTPLETIASGFPLSTHEEGHGILQYNNIWNFPPTLDLSYNNLTGAIWPSFGNLKNLHVLKLQKNNLSGTIPARLSEMTNLEVLDLSHNKLSGEIPNLLEKLTFLSMFSVAYNQLHGEIPTGGQFSSFPSSNFEGNIGLYHSGAITPYQPVEPATPVQPESKKKITIFGLPFGIGAATGFVLTVTFCFMSGWVFPKEKRRKTVVTIFAGFR